jgi:hypothetical protein
MLSFFIQFRGTSLVLLLLLQLLVVSSSFTALRHAGGSIARSYESRHNIRPVSLLFVAAEEDGIDPEGIESEEVDVAIVGAGIGGLCAGAILNTLYGKKVAVFESHYIPGGCAHAFDRKASNGMTFTFDSGPTILLG